MSTLLLSLLFASGPVWAEDAPEFLLGDLGVRIDLPRGWHMTRWSDWDFVAERKSSRDTVLLFAWATPVQVPMTTADGWGPVFAAKVDELKGSDPKVEAGRMSELGGRPVALVDASFDFGEGGAPGVLRGGTVEVAGKNMHVAMVAPKRSVKVAEAELHALFERLDFQTEPEAVVFEATVEASGITTTLPAGWRVPLESEMSEVDPVLAKIGIDDLTPCYTAIHPRPGAAPDVMATCQGGLLLGVVDAHSFDAADIVVHEKMFGAVEIPPAEQVPCGDRVCFLYAPREGLAVAVAPYDKGVARTWVVGEGDLSGAARGVLQGSSWSGPHPAGVGDQLSYWLKHRTTSPVVLCPLIGVVGIGGILGLGVVGLLLRGRGRNKYADLDDD